MQRQSSGNALALSAAMLVFALAVAMVLVNLTWLITGHNEARTAADAAALQAATEISQIAVTTPSGQIGLIDCPAMPPGKDSSHPARSELNAGQGLRSDKPIVAINSALANARVAILVAQDLKNARLQTLAEEELTYLQSVAIPKLNQSISKAIGREGLIRQHCLAVLKSNSVRTGGGEPIERAFRLQLVKPAMSASDSRVWSTNTLTPTGPDNSLTAAMVHNNRYRAFLPIPAGTKSVTFAAVGDTPRLVDGEPLEGLYIGDTIAGSIVRVLAEHKVQLSSPADGKIETRTMASSACAQAGGNTYAAAPTVMTIGFAGGLPRKESLGGTLSANSLMKAAVYQSISKRTWFRSQSSNTPPVQLSQLTPLTPAIESPADALARRTFHWIRSLGINVDRQSLTAALQTQLDLTNVSQSMKDTLGSNGPVTTCLYTFPREVNSDQRYDSITGQYGEENYVNAYYMAFGYSWATRVCPADSVLVKYQPSSGDWSLLNGQSVQLACDLRRDLLKTLTASRVALRAGTLVMQDATVSAAVKKRAEIIHRNGWNKTVEASACHKNLLALTSGGISTERNIANIGITTPIVGVSSFGYRFDGYPNAFFVPSPMCRAMDGQLEAARWESACDFLRADRYEYAPRAAVPFIVQMKSPSAFKYTLANGNGQTWDHNLTSAAGDITIKHSHPLQPYTGSIYINPFVFGTEAENLASAPLNDGGHWPMSQDGQLSLSNLPKTISTNEVSLLWQFRVTNGQIKVSPLLSNDGSYAFASNKLRQGQYLYVATNALITTSSSGAETFWSIIARDQAIDQSAGNAAETLGKDGQPVGAAASNEAFNFRVGCPMLMSCCKEICPAGISGTTFTDGCPVVPAGAF